MPVAKTADYPRLEVRSRAEWRRWLERHHDSSPGVSFVFLKASTGRQKVSYDDAVEEALCFGWIDSVAHTLDHERYQVRFTPRRSGSRWSESNLQRVKRLAAAGLMTPAGLAHAADAETRPALGLEVSDEVGEDLRRALVRVKGARANFRALPPGYVRTSMRWINSAKKPETRARRIAEFVAVTAQGRRIGMK